MERTALRSLLHLVTGGARSGKSSYAEDLANIFGGAHVTYIATLAPDDDEMRNRVHRHRGRRPDSWKTLELTRDVSADALHTAITTARSDTVLLDCVAGLVNTIALEHAPDETATIETALAVAEALATATRDDCKTLIAVTNEVGSGLVPATRLGRLYRDALGLTNQRLAQRADTVTLLTAGLPLTLKSPPQETA